ncbi:hypothetical protein AYI87_18045 [Shewanella sp. KCT]|nr:hypothetical protein AYI87_18045 [Shewanella sp. KCT]
MEHITATLRKQQWAACEATLSRDLHGCRKCLNCWEQFRRLSWPAPLKLRAHKHIAIAIFALLHMEMRLTAFGLFIFPMFE